MQTNLKEKRPEINFPAVCVIDLPQAPRVREPSHLPAMTQLQAYD